MLLFFFCRAKVGQVVPVLVRERCSCISVNNTSTRESGHHVSTIYSYTCRLYNLRNTCGSAFPSSLKFLKMQHSLVHAFRVPAPALMRRVRGTCVPPNVYPPRHVREQDRDRCSPRATAPHSRALSDFNDEKLTHHESFLINHQISRVK